jgi:hypothetical protein
VSPFFRNSFVARPKLLMEYSEFANDAMEMLLTDETFRETQYHQVGLCMGA